jgi:hypothetical protein
MIPSPPSSQHWKKTLITIGLRVSPKLLQMVQGEEVLVVGEFTADWTQPIKANHVSGTKYAVNLRLPQGK